MFESILLYVLEKSSLRKIASRVNLLAQSRVSWMKKTLSKLKQKGKNGIWTDHFHKNALQKIS